MNVEEIPIAELDLDPANVRQHDEKNLAAIKSSLKRFGQQKPIVVDPKGIVIAGNGTLTAARALGWDRIRIVRTQLEGSEATAYAIADNRTAELATWDDDALMQQLSALDLEDSALVEAAGFSAAELEGMVDGLLGEKELNEDEVPEVPEDPITQPGDLWILGDHRLLCGDSTKPQHLERLMDGELANVWLTDPPYNIAYEGGSKKRKAIDNDSMCGDNFRQFLRDAYSVADAHLCEGGAFYIWHADSEGYNFRGAALDIGWNVRQMLIWNKNNSAFAKSDFHWKHESCLYGWKSGAAHSWYNDRKQTTVLDFDRPSRSEEHPTMKPVDLIEYCLGNNTKQHDIVLDSFGGSGTTLISAERMNRKARLMELDPAYCDVIVERWENLTGRKAELERRADDDQEKISSQA